MLAISTVALLGALSCAPAASATGQAFAGGQTQLQLRRGLDDTLRREGVTIAPLGPATLKGRELTLPVASGASDREADSATFVQLGGLRLASGKKGISLRQLTFDASTKSLTATVAGKRMRITRLSGVTLEGDGFDTRLKAKRLPLTRSAAAMLDRVLKMTGASMSGRSLGSLNGLGEPSAVQVDFGTIAMGGPDTTFSKLESLQVQMGIWGASERWAAPGETYFLFPVKPAMVAPDASAGILEGEPNDGLSMEIFAPPPRNMLLREPHIDLAARELSARVSALSADDPGVTGAIATLDYSAATVQVRPKVGAF
jgi:hypothetical protein